MFAHRLRTRSVHTHRYANVVPLPSRSICKGHANPEMTFHFCTQKFPLAPQCVGYGGHKIPRSGLTVSPIGFGSYRVGNLEQEHQYSLQYAIQAGANVIDTSTNYEFGESEHMVGRVITGMCEQGIIDREEIIVMSKVGYIQGPNLKLAKEMENASTPFSDVVKLHPFHWHSIAPDFIEQQLTASLTRLNLECLDVLFLHNPEYCWKHMETDDQFYERIRLAFIKLEEEVRKKRIMRYGISSNTFNGSPNEKGHISVEKCLKIARSISKHHHFECIQFPFNIHEPGAYIYNFYGNESKNLFQFARENGLATFGNRPFNAIDPSGSKLYRFTTFPASNDQSTIEDVQKALNNAISWELAFPGINQLSDQPATVDPKLPRKASLQWGHIIAANIDKMDTYYQFQETMQNRIRPEIGHALDMLRKHPNQSSFIEWANTYKMIMSELLDTYSKFLLFKHNTEAVRVKAHMESVAPELAQSRTMTQQVIRTLCSSGIDCVLVGMRRIVYVKDVLFELGPELPRDRVDRLLREVRWKPIDIVMENKKE